MEEKIKNLQEELNEVLMEELFLLQKYNAAMDLLNAIMPVITPLIKANPSKYKTILELIMGLKELIGIGLTEDEKNG